MAEDILVPNTERYNMSLLSDKRILEELATGSIVIEPFELRQLGTNSYDLRLGSQFWVQNEGLAIVDFTKQNQSEKFWIGPVTAQEDTDGRQVMIIPPGTTILAHTIEIIGAQNGYTTYMKARSSIGRMGLSVCKCAGMGDAGYIARWTMEISNHTKTAIILPVGLRVAQMAFEYIGETTKEYNGKYGDVNEQFDPYDMLPKIYKDWDVHLLKEFNTLDG